MRGWREEEEWGAVVPVGERERNGWWLMGNGDAFGRGRRYECKTGENKEKKNFIF
jgi:hypothetical protein